MVTKDAIEHFVKALGPHGPDGLLAAFLALVMAAGLVGGANPYAMVAGPCLLFLIWLLRNHSKAFLDRRKAEDDLRQIATSRGTRIAGNKARRLRTRKPGTDS